MRVIELTVHTTTEGSELVADLLWDHTTGGVAVLDAADAAAMQRDKRVFWDYIDENVADAYGGEALCKCFLSVDGAQEEISGIRGELEALRRRGEGFVSFGSLETTWCEVDGDAWEEVWKRHFRPLHIGKSIVIDPVWVEYAPAAGEKVLYLDSNMAFGTGEHETTSMCLELLEEYLRPDDTVIDVGCGSGILGIAAVKLGAASVCMTDIDGVAVSSARHNSRINGTEEKTRIVQTDLLDGVPAAGDVVLANITADILCRLSGSIPVCLKDGGILILSGIIEPKLAEVTKSYLAQGLVLRKERREGEWFALAFSKGERK